MGECGWLAAPGVQDALSNGTPAVAPDPANFNRVTLLVRNENTGAPMSASALTALSLE